MTIAEVAPPPVYIGAGAAVATLGAAVAFALAYAGQVAWKNTLRPLLVAAINFSFARVHPFRWLKGLVTAVDGWLDSTVKGCERAMTWSFHSLMWSISTTYAQTRDLAQATWAFRNWAKSSLAFRSHAPALPSYGPRIKTLEREYKVIEAEVKQLERREHAKRGAGAAAGTIDSATLQRGIDRLNARLEHVVRELHGIEHGQEVAGQKVGTKTGAKVTTVPRTVPRVKAHANKWTDVFTHKGLASIAVASLAATGLSWLRCPSLLRMGKRLGCGGFSWLEGFFATAFEALAVLDLCRFALAAQQLARIIVPQLGAVLLVENAVCLGGGASLPSAHDSPQVLTSITPPSAHD